MSHAAGQLDQPARHSYAVALQGGQVDLGCGACAVVTPDQLERRLAERGLPGRGKAGPRASRAQLPVMRSQLLTSDAGVADRAPRHGAQSVVSGTLLGIWAHPDDEAYLG